MKKVLTILTIITICFLVGTLGFCINSLCESYPINTHTEMQVEISEYTQCDALNLEDTSECLRDYIKEFFNYTIRDDTIKTIEDIKKNGGDCYDYNTLYKRLGKELGFNAFDFIIKMGDESHKITIISDETGYCLMDQLHKPSCFRRGIK